MYLKGAVRLQSDGQVGTGFTCRWGLIPLLTWGFSFTAKSVSTYFTILLQAG